ncbi:hypothetical protein LA6_004435 [Marinibacterium anthonyi]|nr:hypothetical protein LA6_004435 [Marinibacterium anthonyi]
MDDAKANSAPFVAVIYFHGMGSQRRYEEGSRLLDSIDRNLQDKSSCESDARLKDIGPRHEAGRTPDDPDVTYLGATYVKAGQPDREIRIYEAYWAPIMADTSSAGAVALWIVRQVRRPFASFFSNWMEFRRLRRSMLAELLDREGGPKTVNEDDYEALCQAYADFGDGRTVAPKGGQSFACFTTFLEDRLCNSTDEQRRVLALARKWRRHFLRREVGNLLFLLTILLAILTSLAACIWGAMMVVDWIGQFVASNLPQAQDNAGGAVDGASTAGMAVTGGNAANFRVRLSEYLNALDFWSIATPAVGILMALGVRKFLTDYMGDVEAWSTYQETDTKYLKRKKVIALGSKVVAHVLGHDRCERAVVVSHSLGTSVALDTLLAMVNTNRVTNPTDPISGPVDLSRIRHFVTAGCPVDKINYFFETYRSGSRNYTRVVEGLRGDIGTEPFSRAGTAHVNWVNFWDRGDIISGPIQSAVAARTLKRRVDNVHVAGMKFPNPGGSHTGYFRDKTIVSTLCGMIFDDAYDSTDEDLRKDEGVRYSNWIYLFAATLPWLAALYIVLSFFGLADGFGKPILVVFTVSVGLLVAINLVLLVKWLLGRYDGRRNPI